MAKHKSLSFIFILCIVRVVTSEGCWSSGYFINVANVIETKDKVLVHCKSKDTDIGQKTIGYNESVSWKFCETIVAPGSLYFCHIYFGQTEQVFDVFNHNMKRGCVEKQKKPYWRCTWLIKKDGVYFVDRTSGERKDIKKYDWKPIGSH